MLTMVFVVVMFVSMLMGWLVAVVRDFLAPANFNCNVHSGYAAFHARFGTYSYIWNADVSQSAKKIIRIFMQLKQCRHQHVSGSTHAAFKV